MYIATDDLHYLDLTELAARIKAREISPPAVTRAQLDRIAALAAYSPAMSVRPSALRRKPKPRCRIAAGRYRGPLHGVPIALKDLCWTRVPTAAGTAIHLAFPAA